MTGSQLRRFYIARGAILPLEDRPTLRLDDAGRAAAARDIAAYLGRPWLFADRPFVQDNLPEAR